MHWGAQPPPFATESEVRRVFDKDKRAYILVPGVQVKF